MQDGYCSKCGQPTIKERTSQVAGLATHIFVCSHCGYLETYVLAHVLPVLEVATDWENVEPRASHRAATGVTTRLQPPSLPPVTSQPATTEKNCPVCHSTRLIPNVRVRDTGQGARGDLSVEVERFPNALFIRGATEGWLSAVVCGKCGYTMFFANNPAELYSAYREVKK